MEQVQTYNGVVLSWEQEYFNEECVAKDLYQFLYPRDSQAGQLASLIYLIKDISTVKFTVVTFCRVLEAVRGLRTHFILCRIVFLHLRSLVDKAAQEMDSQAVYEQVQDLVEWWSPFLYFVRTLAKSDTQLWFWSSRTCKIICLHIFDPDTFSSPTTKHRPIN